MSLQRIMLLLTVVLLGTCRCEDNCSYENISQLINNLPGPNVRPVMNWKNSTIVYVDMTLYSVIRLDTSLQTLTTYVWLTMAWQNEFLTWNPSDYCGIQDMLIPNTNLWLPDLYVHEMTDYSKQDTVISYYKVSNNGRIINSKPIAITSSCNLDMYRFPFDTQTCNLSFHPYIHTVDYITLVPIYNSSKVNEKSKNVFVSKGDWNLLDISVGSDNFTTGIQSYSGVIFQISIKRAPIVYIINLIIPACFMVILDVASMFIQIEAGQRLGFKITVVLGFSVILLILNNMVPSIENPPALAILLSTCLIAMVVSIICSIATSYMLMLSKEKAHVPPWVKICIVKHLSRLLLFKVKAPQENKLDSVKSAEEDNRADKEPETCITIQMSKTNIQIDKTISVKIKVLKRLLVEVLRIHQEIKSSKDQDVAKSDWHFAAMVVDRLVRVAYLIIAILMFVTIILAWTT